MPFLRFFHKTELIEVQINKWELVMKGMGTEKATLRIESNLLNMLKRQWCPAHSSNHLELHALPYAHQLTMIVLNNAASRYKGL